MCADEDLNTTYMHGTDRLNMQMDKVRNTAHEEAQKYDI
jgi:hypothetical protein